MSDRTVDLEIALAAALPFVERCHSDPDLEWKKSARHAYPRLFRVAFPDAEPFTINGMSPLQFFEELDIRHLTAPKEPQNP